MKKLTILLLVLTLVCPLGLTFAEDQTMETLKFELLQSKIQICKESIGRRQAEIRAYQIAIGRLNDQIEVWKSELQKYLNEIAPMEDVRKDKPKESNPEKK